MQYVGEGGIFIFLLFLHCYSLFFFILCYFSFSSYLLVLITLNPASILYKSIAGRYRPVSYPDGPITARYRFIKNAYWNAYWVFYIPLRDDTNWPTRADVLLKQSTSQDHNENTPIQIFRKFHLQKLKIFRYKDSDIFHISAQNIDFGYSLEPPRRGGSNEYPQSIFWAEIWKIMYTPVNPSFTI